MLASPEHWQPTTEPANSSSWKERGHGERGVLCRNSRCSDTLTRRRNTLLNASTNSASINRETLPLAQWTCRRLTTPAVESSAETNGAHAEVEKSSKDAKDDEPQPNPAGIMLTDASTGTGAASPTAQRLGHPSITSN